jgi:lipopolysaccharide transport system ATP-binding protein
MSKPLVVDFQNVGKMYKLYKDRKESLIDLTGISKILPFKRPKINEFWALRDINFQLETGARLGIVGRNGAGKTTLLKLLTGNVAPTEGQVTVNGEVQALLEAGAGFHPEFTGYENVEAALTQAGLTRHEIKQAVEEITEFTELGDFMNQPFKAYSAGMQARLVFTTATTVKPNILIVDEILGAGDAYFAAKSRQRMQNLVDSGASILLVSHALDQVLRFCDQAIWLERGRIVLRGSSLEVVKAYQEFVHELQDKQLKAANQQRRYGFRDAVEVEHFAETLVLDLAATGSPSSSSDVARAELLADNVPVDTVRIGEPQDSDPSHFAYVALNSGNWQSPKDDGDTSFRSLQSGSSGNLIFRTLPLDPGSKYSFRLHYRCVGDAELRLGFFRNGEAQLSNVSLPTTNGNWHSERIELNLTFPEAGLTIGTEQPRRESQTGSGDETAPASPGTSDCARDEARSERPKQELALRRWAGEGSILVESLSFQNEQQQQKAIFRVGDTLTAALDLRITRDGKFPLIVGIVVYTLDGIIVSQNISPSYDLDVRDQDIVRIMMDYPSVNLANGRYVVSVSLHKDLDPQNPTASERYDLIAHSYEFEIVGNPPLRSALVELPAQWRR